MSQQPIGNMLFRAVRALLIAVFKVLALACAWVCKVGGILLTKIGEAIEKVIARQS
jgi:hypothetical protein